MNLFDDGVGVLLDAFEASVSKTMVYRRGSLAVVVTVTQGQTEYQTYDDVGNLVTAVTDATFIMRASRLVFNGVVAEPEPGDTIEETAEGTIAGQSRKYEVMPQGNLQCFTRDPTGQLLRIHTKLIETE